MTSFFTELKDKLATAERATDALLEARQELITSLLSVEDQIATLTKKQLLLTEEKQLQGSIKEMRLCVRTLGGWKTRVVAGEPVILTVHNSGELDGPAAYKPRYNIVFRDGVFEGFQDPTTDEIFTSPSGLCCARLSRSGPKKTNQWQGPAHCLVLRKGNWTPLNKL